VGLKREKWYSRGIRQELYRLATEQGWKEKYKIQIGAHGMAQGYSIWLARSKFCLVLPGGILQI
jgi:hypothetical protein